MKPRLMDGNGNAILVADGIPTACKYYEIFQQMGFKKCAIISSYTPNKGELRTERANWPKKIGRNDPCPCGSGKKYKFCHGKN